MFEISRRDLVLGSTGAALVFGLKGPVSFIGAAHAQSSYPERPVRLISVVTTGISAVLSISVPEEELVRRLAGRLVCREASHPYHETDAPPEAAGVCDVDGSELYRRKDDQEDVVRARYRVFQEQTAPVLDHYRRSGTPILEIDGARDREAVERDLLDALDGLAG